MKKCKAQKFTVWAESVKSRALQFPGWFGKHPATVLLDESISYGSRVLFGILALKTYKTREKCNRAEASVRGLAVLLGTSQTTIATWIRELEGAGHIERASGRNARGTYLLLSPVFEFRVRVETAPNEAVEIGSKDLQPVRERKTRCPKCKEMARIKSTSGVCAACLAEWARKTA